MTALIGVAAAGVAGGAWLVVTGLRSQERPPDAPKAPSTSRRQVSTQRLLRAGGAGVVVLLATRWPIAACGAALMGWWSPELFATKASRGVGLARTEAVATWTEMLRDTIGSAHGLEAAITTTAPLAPVPIRPEVTQLARSLRHTSLTTALRQLATDLTHPIADLVVASLTVAANGAVKDLADLLSMLAESARDEAAMQLRVEASRARMRTAVRVIAAVTITTAAGLVVLNPTYVDVYTSVTGQVVLVGIVAVWGAALWWLTSMSRFRAPERFLIAAVTDGPTR